MALSHLKTGTQPSAAFFFRLLISASCISMVQEQVFYATFSPSLNIYLSNKNSRRWEDQEVSQMPSVMWLPIPMPLFRPTTGNIQVLKISIADFVSCDVMPFYANLKHRKRAQGSAPVGSRLHFVSGL